jgi:hypothetical protein
VPVPDEEKILFRRRSYKQHYECQPGMDIKKGSMKDCPYWDLDTSYMGLLINCNVGQPTDASPEYGNIRVLRCINSHVIFSFIFTVSPCISIHYI